MAVRLLPCPGVTLRQLSPRRYSAHARHARPVGPAALQNERPQTAPLTSIKLCCLVSRALASYTLPDLNLISSISPQPPARRDWLGEFSHRGKLTCFVRYSSCSRFRRTHSIHRNWLGRFWREAHPASSNPDRQNTIAPSSGTGQLSEISRPPE